MKVIIAQEVEKSKFSIKESIQFVENVNTQVSHSSNPVVQGDPVSREMVNATVSLSELIDLIRSGYAFGAIVKGRHIEENFLSRGEIQIDIAGDIEKVLHNEFFKKYGLLVYTVAPNCHRAMFRLSKKVRNIAQYERYVSTLNFHLEGSVADTKSAMQIYFAPLGSEVYVNGKTLPLHVIESLKVHDIPEIDYAAYDSEGMLRIALERAREGNRDTTVFGLSLNLRRLKISYEVAKSYVLKFQQAVANIGYTRYTVEEATQTLDKVYTYERYGASDIDTLRMAAMANLLDISVNVTKTLFAILSVMEKVKITKNVTISMNQMNRAVGYHIAKMNLSHHIAVLEEKGILKVKDNGKSKPFSYTLLVSDSVSKGMESMDLSYGEGLTTSVEGMEFDKLNSRAFCESGARIDPELALNDNDVMTHFGPSAQRIITALSARPDGIDSQKELIEITGLSKRCVINTVKSLVEQGIIIVKKEWKTNKMTLARSYMTTIKEIEPALTVWGRNITREEQALKEKIAYNEFIATHSHNRTEVINAKEQINIAKAHLEFVSLGKQCARSDRRIYAVKHGIDSTLIPLLY